MGKWLLKFRVFSLHLVLSAVVALLVVALVFGVWYPYPYRDIFGGRELLILVIAADVVMGPLTTFIVFNPMKSLREKILDFSIVGLLQFGALFYGLWTVFEARPVYTVFEYDRFRVVSAIDVPQELLIKAPNELQKLPITGPAILSLRSMSASEQMEMTISALNGVSLSARPELWQSYGAARDDVIKASRPMAQLIERLPDQLANMEKIFKSTGIPVGELGYIPLLGRKEVVWTTIIDRRNANVVTYLPVDSF